jgi:branched-chain amino acid transport system substrate-binding protein
VLDPVSYSSGDADFRAVLTQVRSQNPDAVFATGYYPEAAIIVRQARELGIKGPILGGDGWVGDALKNGREALNGCYIANHYSGDNPDPVVQNFVKTYRSRFNRDPDSIAALAYDAVKVLADAMTRANTTEGPRVRDALAQADVQGVTGRLKMNPRRDVDKPAVIQELVFENGEVKFVYKTTIQPN